MCYMSTPVGKKRKRKEKSALKLIKTDQHVKHCIRIKNLLFVNTNTNNVPKSGYNQIDVARIVFIFVCVRVCVLFCYWLSHVYAIAHRWIIGWLSKVLRSYLTLSKLRPTWIEDKMYLSKCKKLKCKTSFHIIEKCRTYFHFTVVWVYYADIAWASPHRVNLIQRTYMTQL